MVGTSNRWGSGQHRASVREVVRKSGSELLINQMQPMDHLVSERRHKQDFPCYYGVFSVIAVLLAGVGLYGVLATWCGNEPLKSDCEWPWEQRRQAFSV
jgi:hypothetical protein